MVEITESDCRTIHMRDTRAIKTKDYYLHRVRELYANPVPDIDRQTRNKVSEERGIDILVNRGIERDFFNLSRTNFLSDPRYEVIDTIPEYVRIMVCLAEVSGTNQDDNCLHEVAHFRKALEVGFPEPFFIFYFSVCGVKNERGFQPCMSIGRIPDKMTNEEFRKAYRAVLSAPTNLSELDKRILQASEVNNTLRIK